MLILSLNQSAKSSALRSSRSRSKEKQRVIRSCSSLNITSFTKACNTLSRINRLTDTMPNYKLIYFDSKGRGENTRMMFRMKKVPFEDKRVTKEEWQAMKPDSLYGGLPMFEVDGHRMAQTRSIERFVAKELGFYGKTRLEEAKIDEIIDAFNDIITEIITAMHQPDEEKKKAMLKTFGEDKMPGMFANIEKNVGSNGFAVGNQITWADLEVYNTLTMLPTAIGLPMPVDKLPKLKKIQENIAKCV